MTHQEGLSLRYEFTQALTGLNEQAFMSECERMVNQTNPWYDRIAEFAGLSVCEGQWQASQNLTMDTLQSSYLSSLKLNLDA